MRVLFIADEPFADPRSGGQAELRGEALGLHNSSAQVSAIITTREQIASDYVAQHTQLVDALQVVERKGFVTSSLRHPATPFQASSRVPPIPLLSHDPWQMIVCSHEWTVPLAQFVARNQDTRPTLVLRAHNIEPNFLRSLATNSRGTRAWYYRVESFRARGFCRKVWDAVDHIAWISDQDAAAVAHLAIAAEQHVVAPVLADAPQPPNKRTPPSGNGIVFLGAVDMAHTAAGVSWFLDNVFPLIRAAVPTARLTLAGRGTDTVVDWRQPGVEALGAVRDAEALLRHARVFINPIFDGSGVNLKLGPPAVAGLPIVSTSFGVRGLNELAPACSIADDPASFSRAVIAYFADCKWSAGSQAVQSAVRNYSPRRFADSILNLAHSQQSPQSH